MGREGGERLVRAVATSFAALKHFPFKDIVSADYWKNENMLISLYM
jgi:hypothetical protein